MTILIDYRPALRQRSGVGEFVHQLVLALHALGASGGHDHRVIVFSSSWKDRLDTRALPDDLETHDRRIPVATLNWLWHHLEWPPVERLVGASPDVTHSPHPLLLPTRAGAQVVTIHDLDFLDHPERTAREIRRDYPALVRAHARRAGRVLVPSAFTAGEVANRLGIATDRIVRCPLGAPTWPPRERTPEDGYVLFVGTLEPRKNLAGLIEAYRTIVARGTDVPPLLVAGRAGEASADLAAARASDLGDRVRYAGYVPERDRRSLYEGARVLVMPSLSEGFGLPALEAMTVGVPVIASRRGALPELVGDAGLLVDGEDPEELAAAIEQLLTDESRARGLVERGLRRAEAFTWRACAEAAVEAYRGAAAETPRRPRGLP